MARGARLSGSRFAYRFGDVAHDRDGAVPLRARPPGRQGVHDRAAAGAGRRARHVRHRVPAHRGVQPLPPGTGQPVPDRDLGSGAGGHPHRRAAREEDQLPARYAAFTTNFRREAGAAGKDTKGMFRVHQFDKVEMYVYCAPEQSAAFHEELLAHEEEIVQALGLPYRVMNIAVGDLGAPGGQEVRHRGVVPGPAALPGDHLLLEHHRLPGPAAEHPVPPRGQAALRAHPQRHRRDGPVAAVDHGELPGRAGRGGRPGGAPELRGTGHPRRQAGVTPRSPVLA